MRILNYQKLVKSGVFAMAMLAFGIASAQQTTGDIAQQGNADPGTTDTSVKLIDNKGTIKYLQVANGITSLTNTTADRTTTTWQLGGALTDDTFIDVDGNVFGLDGIELVTTVTASTDATTESDHGVGSGYTILVRDEATGATKKLLATDLIQSGQSTYTALAADETADPSITATGVSITASQVWVYRNGAKLVVGDDYSVTANTVTLDSAGYPIYAGDFFEVQWVK